MKRLILFLSLLSLIICLGADARTINVVVGQGGVAVVNGAIGYSSGVDDSDSYPGGEPHTDACFWQTFTTTTAGTIRYIHGNMLSATTTAYFNAAIYNSGGTLLADGQLTLGADPLHIQLDSDVVIEAAQTYTLVIGSKDDSYWGMDKVNTPGTSLFYDTDYDIEDAMPSTVPDQSGTSSNYTVHIWATNTSDGT
jgi:hypothetical protein